MFVKRRKKMQNCKSFCYATHTKAKLFNLTICRKDKRNYYKVVSQHRGNKNTMIFVYDLSISFILRSARDLS